MGGDIRTATVGGGIKSTSAERDESFAGAAPQPPSRDNTDRNHNDFPEIDCLRSMLSAQVLSDAEDRATRLGIGADRVLIASGEIDEETYLRCLGKALGIKFEPLFNVPRELCPLTDDRLIKCNSDGLLSLTINNEIILVLAPREIQARWLTRLIYRQPLLAARLRLTTSEEFSNFILRCAESTLLNNAVNSLRQRWPELSAGPPRRMGRFFVAAVAVILLLCGLGLATRSFFIIFEASLAIFFMSWALLRLASLLVTWRKKQAPPLDMTDNDLPVYSIIAALYNEAKSVDKLLRNFERLNYPPEKLDIILAIEKNDHSTRAAIEARSTSIPIRVIVCPNASPRTKPKALNIALPFARGNYIVVYDAEDRPQSDQLRQALQAFNVAGDDLICVQAQLSIDNTNDSWLTKFFTAEYAGHFDVFLIGLAKMCLPLPLGGTSNHFRTEKLREIGAWDPYNVTEDADLGIRMARLGYRCDVIQSTTDEEAPAHYVAWLRQRTRWFKGWMQTWAVHMRHPLRLLRELGIAGFITFQLIVGGSVFAALVHPLFLLTLVVMISYDFMSDRSDGPAISVALFTILIGYLPSILMGWLGLARSKLISITPILFATPLHWVILSHAAWRALKKFIFDLYEWEKTEHGLAKNSRLADATARSLVLLERDLTGLPIIGKPSDLAKKSRRTNGPTLITALNHEAANKDNAVTRPHAWVRRRFDRGYFR